MNNNKKGLEVGDYVRIDPNQLKNVEPNSWKNLAEIVSIVKDETLTDMNKKGLDIYRINIKFKELPFKATPDEIEMFGYKRCYTASILPRLLQKV